MAVKTESRSEQGKVGGGRSKKAQGHGRPIPLLGKENKAKPTTSDELFSVLGSWADQRVNEHSSYVQSQVEKDVGDLHRDVPPHVGCKVVVGGSHSFGGLEGTVVGTDRDRLVVRLNTVDDEGEPVMLTLAPGHCTKVGTLVLPRPLCLWLSSFCHESEHTHTRFCRSASLPADSICWTTIGACQERARRDTHSTESAHWIRSRRRLP